MPDREFVLGLDCMIWINNGSWAAPEWDLVRSVRDVTVNLEAGEWEGSTRGSRIRKYAQTLLAFGIDLELLHKPGDDHQRRLREAWLNNELIDLAICDGNINHDGTEVVRAEWAVFNYSRGEPLEEGATRNVTIKPGISANEPQVYIVENNSEVGD